MLKVRYPRRRWNPWRFVLSPQRIARHQLDRYRTKTLEGLLLAANSPVHFFFTPLAERRAKSVDTSLARSLARFPQKYRSTKATRRRGRCCGGCLIGSWVERGGWNAFATRSDSWSPWLPSTSQRSSDGQWFRGGSSTSITRGTPKAPLRRCTKVGDVYKSHRSVVCACLCIY